VAGVAADCPALELEMQEGKKDSSFSEEKEAKRLFVHLRRG
jgi:hypothetical protein